MQNLSENLPDKFLRPAEKKNQNTGKQLFFLFLQRHMPQQAVPITFPGRFTDSLIVFFYCKNTSFAFFIPDNALGIGNMKKMPRHYLPL
jgi:hypothetical protein